MSVRPSVCPVDRQQQRRPARLLHWRSQGEGAKDTPLPRNWVHKKIPGCAVELNTQNCAWFGSQISLITAMSFREAMLPRTTHQGLCPWIPLGDFRSPDPLCPPTSKSWLRHWFAAQVGRRQQISLDSCCCRAIHVPRNFGPTVRMSNTLVVFRLFITFSFSGFLRYIKLADSRFRSAS